MMILAASIMFLFIIDRIRKGKGGAYLAIVLVVAWLGLVLRSHPFK
jgi:hypothetical protein